MNALVSSGVSLMLLGMGTVFVFLTLLVFTTYAMSAFARRFDVGVDIQASVEMAQEARNIQVADAHLLEVLKKSVQSYKKQKLS